MGIKRWSLVVLSAWLAWFCAGAANAQRGEPDRFGFGIGGGLVDLSATEFDDDSETYFTASLRILLGDKDRSRRGKKIFPYLEPEIGYWEVDSGLSLRGGDRTRGTQNDLLVGINLVGVVPFAKADYFFGGGVGFHTFDTDLDVAGVDFGNDEHIGLNVHFGVDVHAGEVVGFFALLRLDYVEDVQEEQAKLVVGLRFSFG